MGLVLKFALIVRFAVLHFISGCRQVNVASNKTKFFVCHAKRLANRVITNNIIAIMPVILLRRQLAVSHVVDYDKEVQDIAWNQLVHIARI